MEVNWVINALSCVFNNLGVHGSGLWLVLLARRQVLHVEGVIGVLGGRAEPLVKTNQKRKVGQEFRMGTNLPRGQRVERAPRASQRAAGETHSLPCAWA